MKRLAILLVAVLAIGAAFAKGKEDSYNLRRASELLDERDMDKALEYLQREVAENPKSAKAYDMMGFIYLNQQRHGKALTAFDNAIKYYPKKDKEGLALTRYYRSRVNLELQDTVAAISDLEIAHRLQPNDVDYQTELSDAYFRTKRYRDAERVYREMMKLDAGDPFPYYGLARNAYNEQQYALAREYTAKSRLLDPSSIMPDLIDMRIARLEKNYPAMVPLAISALEKDIYDPEAYHSIMFCADSCYTATFNALTKKAFNDKPQKANWEYILGMAQRRHKDYDEAIRTLNSVAEESDDLKPMALQSLMDCYDETGELEKVEELANAFLEIFPDDINALLKRADARFFSQKLDESKDDFMHLADIEPEIAGFCFYRTGWIADMQGNYEQALEDYNKSIALDDDYAFTYMMKGNLLIDYLNRPEEGREALRLCIEKDSIMEEGTAMQYAYVGLGERDKAVEIVDSILSLNPDNAGNYYDAACVYSRLKERDNALKSLRTAFEKGYRKIRHVEADDDLDFIRDTPEYRQLIEQYSRPAATKDNDASQTHTEVHEIPLTRQPDGTYIIKASVNDLPMDFILDTGCSTVSLSQVESDFMLKNGYLSRSDVKGSGRYTDANGNTSTNRTVNLATIRIGDLEVNNIRAGIIPNQKAPLLLGQQVLNRFGKVEIDSKTNILRITVIK